MSHHRNMYYIKYTSQPKYTKDCWRLTSWRRYRSTLFSLWVMVVEPTWIFRRSSELWDGPFFCWAFLPSVVQHYHQSYNLQVLPTYNYNLNLQSNLASVPHFNTFGSSAPLFLCFVSVFKFCILISATCGIYF